MDEVDRLDVEQQLSLHVEEVHQLDGLQHIKHLHKVVGLVPVEDLLRHIERKSTKCKTRLARLAVV